MDAFSTRDDAPDDADEIVSTSDPGEREELEALRDDYWEDVLAPDQQDAASNESATLLLHRSPTPDPLDVLAHYSPSQPVLPVDHGDQTAVAGVLDSQDEVSQLILGHESLSPARILHTPSRARAPARPSPLATPGLGDSLFTPARAIAPALSVGGSPLTPLRPSPPPPNADFFSDDERDPPAGPSRPPPPSPPPPDIPPDNRYSLRRRDPKQLHPYEYDKKLYKRMMRGNPDAIVRLRSPGAEGHPPAQQEHGAQEETQDGEYVYHEPQPRPRREGDGELHGDQLADHIDRFVKAQERKLRVAHADEPPRKKQKLAHDRAAPFPLDRPQKRRHEVRTEVLEV